MQPLFRDLISKGYFPREAPPPFTTTQLASFLKAPSFLLQLSSFRKSARMMHHNLVRVGRLRRELGIPNPVAHIQLAKHISDNWPVLQEHLRKSKISASSPTRLRRTPRALLPKHPYVGLPALRAGNRSACRYLMCTDIAEFYGSIYTHSVPWSLHTKSVAKADRSSRLLGNVLDADLRRAQDQQTVGIPIGPDTSLVIAELLLAAVDELLRVALAGTSRV